jgi:arsenite methyltransferase
MNTQTLNEPDTIRTAVRERYGSLARRNDQLAQAQSGCGGSAAPAGDGGCCGKDAPASAGACCGSPVAIADYSAALGYSAGEQAAVPAGSNLGLGCGNPLAAARLQPGFTVLDLGSGAGFDCFLAAAEVGPAGRVIGVDMTAEMVLKARRHAGTSQYANVEFRLGEIEFLPVADASVDVVISNCVINLSPDKPQVFREAFRALKPGGRLCISDVVTGGPLPEEVRRNVALHSGCLAGASIVGELQAALVDAGFSDVNIQAKDESREFIKEWAPGLQLEEVIVSALIEAVKIQRP